MRKLSCLTICIGCIVISISLACCKKETSTTAPTDEQILQADKGKEQSIEKAEKKEEKPSEKKAAVKTVKIIYCKA